MDVCAVVVTYNRKILLKECIEALLAQDYRLTKILIIDNASTDGSYDYLMKNDVKKEIIDYRIMDYNLGGAGGFYEGIRIARDEGFDWIWIMDDDTVSMPNTLSALVEAVNYTKNTSFVASCVKSINNEPMNVPSINAAHTKNGYSDWYMHLEHKLISIERATFVSIMINRDAVNKIGLPCRNFFIWGDDSEYTYRLVQYFGKAYLVGDSWVIHKRSNSKYIDISLEDDTNRITNYHYYYRNKLSTIYCYKGFIKYIIAMISYVVCGLRMKKDKSWGKKILVICKGCIESVGFKNEISAYISRQISK